MIFASLVNAGKKFESDDDNYVIINCFLNAPLMLISIIGNTLVLAAMLRTPSLRSPSMILLCSLAVSDLLVGLVVQPLYIAKELTEDLFLFRISYFMSFSSCGVSLCTVAAISLDRFAALHYHMRYVTIVTTTRVVYTLVLIWLTIFLGFSVYLWSVASYFICVSAVIVTCLLISSFCYIRIFQIVKRHQRQVHAQQQVVQSSEASNNLNIMRLKKSSMNTFVFYVFLILCYFPMFILLMLKVILRKDLTRISAFSATVVFMNSSINPFLYCWGLSELRTAVVKTARKMFCAKEEQE
ncbi:melanocyte-stimulating hormone receptor-like [Oculina patagonica]